MNRPIHVPIKLLDIDRCISNGEYVIPDFQRDFVWDLEQSAKLLDSWIKGYPLGSFILWTTDETLCPIKEIGDFIFTKKDETQKSTYVLDGQQRITSIFAAIKGLKVKRKDYSDIVINLDVNLDNYDEEIVCVRDKAATYTYISFKDLYSQDFEVWLKYDESHREVIKKLHSDLLQFDFSTIKIENSSIEVATEIFTRLNTGGRKLSTFEIMTAKTYKFEEFNLVDKAKELKDDLDYDFKEIVADSDILKMVALCVKKESSNKAQLALSRDEMISNFDDVKSALNKAISFCKTDIKIPVGKVMAYTPILYLLVYFFFEFNKTHNLSSPSTQQSEWLVDYYWRCVLTERFARSTDAITAHDLKFVIDKILQNQEPEQNNISITVDGFIEKGAFDKKSAYIKGMIGMLMSLGPKSLKKNSLVTFDEKWASKSDKNNYHHFFPQKMENQIWNNNEPVNNICNIILCDASTNQIDIGNKRPSQYIPEFEKINKELEGTLKSHLILDIEKFGVLEDNFDLFIKERAKTMIKEIVSRLKLISSDKIPDELRYQ